MNEVIHWLRHLEELAFQFYEHASESMKSNPVLSRFLKELSEDEAWHYQMLDGACDLAAECSAMSLSTLKLDETNRKAIEKPLQMAFERLKADSLDQRSLVRSIVDLEFSEWNHIFLLVMNSCQKVSRVFQRAASDIQEHEDRISKFVQQLPPEDQPQHNLESLPPVWTHRFLIVEDEDSVRNLMQRLLSKQARVDVASNGHEAMEKTRANFYNVIISDYEMPGMNGLEFYREAAQAWPDVKKRFLMYTGYPTEEVDSYCHENQIPLMLKPFPVDQLRKQIQSMLVG